LLLSLFSGIQVKEWDILCAGFNVTMNDVQLTLNDIRRANADTIGAPKIPKVTWDDVGGLSDVKETILDTIQLPMKFPELFKSGIKKRSGIFMIGMFMIRAVVVWASWNWKDAHGQSHCHHVFLVFFICQGSRTTQHVYW
jgi:hypothetical protein